MRNPLATSKKTDAKKTGNWLEFLTKYPDDTKFWIKVAAQGILLFYALGVGVSLLVEEALPAAQELIIISARQVLPSNFDPIARFAANVDWESNTISLDASMSKAVNDQIDQFIWRIDDGSSLTGSAQFQHTFDSAGYYFIQLSIVDSNGQSDAATCRILFPPQEVREVTTTNQSGETITNQSQWVPVGTFFNYTKLNRTSYADLTSRYVDADCGFSNKGYNVTDVSQNSSLRNRELAKQAGQFVISLVEVGIVAGLYLFLAKKISHL